MIRLLLDQGLPRSAARLLMELGWDVVHAADIGMSRATDADILQRALNDQRVCVTLDADFHALLATSGESRPSVIRIRRQGLDAPAVVRLLIAVLPGVEPQLLSGAMITITERSVRTRRLPVPPA